jgi:hypothetical protein
MSVAKRPSIRGHDFQALISSLNIPNALDAVCFVFSTEDYIRRFR